MSDKLRIQGTKFKEALAFQGHANGRSTTECKHLLKFCLLVLILVLALYAAIPTC